MCNKVLINCFENNVFLQVPNDDIIDQYKDMGTRQV